MIRMSAIFLCFVFLYSETAAAPQPPEFKETYETYLQLVEKGEEREAIPYARKALDIALASKAFDDKARAKLAFNLGHVYLLDDQVSAAIEAFTQSIELMDKTSGSDGLGDLKAEALVYRGTAYRSLYKTDEARDDFKQALGLLTGDNVTVQIVRAEALENLAWVHLMERDPNDARKAAEEAYEIYSGLLTDRHPRTIGAMIAVSASAYLSRHRGKARDILARAIHLAEQAGVESDEPGAERKPGQFTIRQMVRFHRNVAALYEIMDREGDARHHERVADDLRKGIPPPIMRVTPIQREPPRYPSRAARKGVGGWALVEYTVRKDGSTADIRIIDSAPDGYFERTSVKAVEEWKYAPPMEDGKSVEVKNVRTMIQYALE